jgi:hypothetical protein
MRGLRWGVAVVLVAARARAADTDVRVMEVQLEVEQRLLDATARRRADHAESERLAAMAVENAAASVRTTLLRAPGTGPVPEGAPNVAQAQAALADSERALLALLTESRAQSLALEDQALRVEALTRAFDALRRRGPATPLDGTWDLAMTPAGRQGVLHLVQTGTLVTGDYAMADGSTGSLTGTFAGNRARLERVDAAAGRDSVLDGTLTAPDQLEGTWLATIFGRGVAESGTWIARRKTDLPPAAAPATPPEGQ